LRTRAIPERFCGGDSLRRGKVYAPLLLLLRTQDGNGMVKVNQILVGASLRHGCAAHRRLMVLSRQHCERWTTSLWRCLRNPVN